MQLEWIRNQSEGRAQNASIERKEYVREGQSWESVFRKRSKACEK
jgi:hypothetical protein